MTTRLVADEPERASTEHPAKTIRNGMHTRMPFFRWYAHGDSTMPKQDRAQAR